MKKRLYIYLKNREEIDKGIRNYIKFENKKGEDKTMNKIEYMRKQKARKEEHEKKYFENEIKKMEEERMDKKEFIRMYKDFKGEKESKQILYFVKFPEEFINGETMTMLEKINKTAYWMFVEMVFETNRTAGLIQKNSRLLRRIIANTERNVGHQLTIDEIVKAINTLIGFNLIKKTIIGMRILIILNFIIVHKI